VQNALDQKLWEEGYDIFSVRHLLEALDYSLDEQLEKLFPANPAACEPNHMVDGKCSDGQQLTGRYDGLVIQVDLHFLGDVNTYEYRVSAVTPQYSRESIVEQQSNYINYKLNGVLIRFQFTGVIKYFDWQNFLVQLISGFVLLGYTKIAVELAMTLLLPNKSKYRLFKYEATPDFSTQDPDEKHHYQLRLARLSLEYARTMGLKTVPFKADEMEDDSLQAAAKFLKHQTQLEETRLNALCLGRNEASFSEQDKEVPTQVAAPQNVDAKMVTADSSAANV
jgi:hypothetical protein